MCSSRCCVQVRVCASSLPGDLSRFFHKCWCYSSMAVCCFVTFLIPSEVKKPVNLCKPNPCMNDGVCILSGGSYRCRCQNYEGPHCETSGWLYFLPVFSNTSVFFFLRPFYNLVCVAGSSRPSRGDLPRTAALRKKSRKKKSHQELLHHYKLHRRRNTA